MKIQINEIPEEGSEIKLKATAEDFDLSGEEFFLKEPVVLKVNVRKAGSKIVVKGVIQTQIQLECSRCLEELFLHIDEPFTATFLPITERPNNSDLELESEDLDISYYDGQVIDLTELVREQIILAIPMNAVCRLNCRGLCPECGKNLNEGRCGCSGSRGDMRWSKLKDFKNE